MGKWHINKKGVPAICKATKGKCPLGEHYSSEEQAINSYKNEMEQEYGLLPTKNKMTLERKKDIADLITRISGTKAPGFDYECFASLSLAEEMGLDRIAITDENGLTVNISTDSDKKQINAEMFVDKSIEAVNGYYKKLGITIKNKETLARVVYYNENPNKGVLVQSGGPNVLDAAIIKANEVVDIVEIKKLSTGAQLPVTSLTVDRKGKITDESLAGQSLFMKQALENVTIQDSDGQDVKIDFGTDMNNERFPLHYFVEQYKAKGATSFLYTTENGDKINKIDLTKETEVVIDDLINKGIAADIKLRANLSYQNANKDDIERFNNLLSKNYFKSGRASTTESFTLKSVKEDKITKAGKLVRVGGYILPIEYESYKENLNKRIKKTELKAFKLCLTGSMKVHY